MIDNLVRVSLNCQSERKPCLGNCVDQWWFALTGSWCRRAKFTMGGWVPQQVVMSPIRKIVKYKPVCKPSSKWFYPFHLLRFFGWKLSSFIRYKAIWNSKQSNFKFLSWFSSVMEYDLKFLTKESLSSHRLLLVREFYQGNRMETRTMSGKRVKGEKEGQMEQELASTSKNSQKWG